MAEVKKDILRKLADEATELLDESRDHVRKLVTLTDRLKQMSREAGNE